jgi:hypothetical protein
VVFPEHRQPLQFGVGFGQREHGRIARKRSVKCVW